MTKPILFPFPSTRLGPNSRSDRRAMTALRRQARDTGFLLTKEAGLEVAKGPLKLTIIFSPPDARRRDLDGMFSCMKSYLDGMFAALQLDDQLIERVVLARIGTSLDGRALVMLESVEGPLFQVSGEGECN
jgi:crossover junction endodeoxyribonuclease RusA